ncbi:MAG: glutamate racemase [Patescibacteria group bacterium]
MLTKKNKTTTTKNIIGVFDSGLGGLTVFKHFLKDLPEYNYIYLGDNARLPYGEKSSETIYEYSREAIDFLFKQGCNLIIIACNTASARALRQLQQEYLPANYPNRKILGVIRPLAEKFASRNIRKVGVIGTKSTINSKAYEIEIKKINPNIKVEEISSPLLVPLIEEGWAKKPETKMILKKYLHPLKTKQIEALILGCTHYPFLLSEIRKIMGKRISVPDPGQVISDSLKTYLTKHPELGLAPSPKKIRQYYTTDDIQTFKALGEKFLGGKMLNIEQAKITDL